jgi:hypothetical protein
MKIIFANQILALIILISCLFITDSKAQTNDNIISLKKMTDDVSYLASDELNGRASFSPEIDQAANYISQRFKQIGLQPMAGEKHFQQRFFLTNIAPLTVNASLNGRQIDNSQVTFASTLSSLSWQSPDDVITHVIAEKDNMRAVINEINQQGGQHLILIHPSHQKMFNGYSGYFSRGLNKLSTFSKGAIVMLLTDEKQIESINIKAQTAITEQQLTNVVAILPGQDVNNKQAQEIVLYSAHYDHLGAKASGDGDLIYNGADDDASGTAAIINLAEYFAKNADNTRTLMFSAFTAEEIGGFGSRYFSQQLDPSDVVAMINIEMIGKPSKFGAGTLWMTGIERSNLGQLLNQQLKAHQAEIYQDPYPEQGLFYRSDNATLARLGVPAHSFSSTQLDKDKHYHKVSDDIASLNLTSMHQVIKNLAIATQGLVTGVDTPSRVDISQVRAIGKIF